MRLNKYLLYFLLILVGVVGFFSSEWNFNLSKKVTLLLMFITFVILIYKEFKVIFPYFVNYMLDIKKIKFDKKIEKPRLLFYIIFGAASLTSYFIVFNINEKQTLYSVNFAIFIMFYTFSVYMLYFTWLPQFNTYLIPKIQKNLLEKENKNFTCQYTYEELSLIYDQTNDLDFIEIISDDLNIEEKELFISTFINGIIPENTIFKLKMDHRQTKLYFDIFSKLLIEFTLDDFLNIFENKNGKTTREKLEPSSANKDKKIPPKKNKDIEHIFEFLNSKKN